MHLNGSNQSCGSDGEHAAAGSWISRDSSLLVVQLFTQQPRGQLLFSRSLCPDQPLKTAPSGTTGLGNQWGSACLCFETVHFDQGLASPPEHPPHAGTEPAASGWPVAVVFRRPSQPANPGSRLTGGANCPSDASPPQRGRPPPQFPFSGRGRLFLTPAGLMSPIFGAVKTRPRQPSQPVWLPRTWKTSQARPSRLPETISGHPDDHDTVHQVKG
jgi:hypothetical protein